MSFGIIRMQKIKADGVRGIQIHDLREKKSLTNPDIDEGLSDQNYSLIKSENYQAKIKENLSTLESKKAVRKDAVVMCQILVTSDSEFFKKISENDEKKFFKEALDFVAEKYGKNNIISATVHKDEKTPHLHINLTPIKDLKLTAKTIFDRNGLKDLHTDFFNAVGQNWDLERGENSTEKRYHLKTEEFKLKTQIQQLEQEHKERLRQTPETALKIPQIKLEELTPKKVSVFKKETPEQITERINTKLASDVELNNYFLALNSSKKDLHLAEKNNQEADEKIKQAHQKETDAIEKAKKTMRKWFKDEYLELKAEKEALAFKTLHLKTSVENEKREEIDLLKNQISLKDKQIQEQEDKIKKLSLENKEKDLFLKAHNLVLKEFPVRVKMKIDSVFKEMKNNPNWEKENSKKTGISR